PADAQNAGVRFFRPDRDVRPEHFSVNGLEIVSETKIGDYSIEALDLNRLHLRRLRDIRQRFSACDQYVGEGVAASRNFRIDLLPPSARTRALKARDRIVGLADTVKHGLDELLRDSARSGLLDPDPEAEKRFRERTQKLKGYESLYPGNWRGRGS